MLKRKNLGFFDLIAVKKRHSVFLRKERNSTKSKENEMFILLPVRHHYSWKTLSGRYRFFTGCIFTQQAQWKQGPKASRFVSKLPLSGQHYHQCSYTLHLQKIFDY